MIASQLNLYPHYSFDLVRRDAAPPLPPRTYWYCDGTRIQVDSDPVNDDESTCITRSESRSDTECVMTPPPPTTTDPVVIDPSFSNDEDEDAMTTDNSNSTDNHALVECHLFLARSTIPNAGLGIFTGRPYSVHPPVPTHHHNHQMMMMNDTNPHGTNPTPLPYIGLGDICIPLIDMYTHINFYHHHHRSRSMDRTRDSSDTNTTATATTTPQQPQQEEDPPQQQPSVPLFHNPNTWHPNRHWVFNPLRDYFWNGYSAMGMIHGESNTIDIEAYCPGLDCAINCHLGLTNVDASVPLYNDYHSIQRTTTTTTTSDRSLPQRQVHPGTGAYSPYHIRPPTSTSSSFQQRKKKKKTNVLRNIPTGGELFKHYGESWFTTRPEIFGNIPLTQDYVLAEIIVQNFMKLRAVRSDIVIEDFYNHVVIPIQQIFDTRTLNALPKLFSEVRQVHTVDNDDHMNPKDDDGIITRILQKKHQRSIHELQQTGVCLDHIRPDTSTIPYAGDGAFATRNLPNHTILTISPLHHIPNYYNFMSMYRIQRNHHNKKKPPFPNENEGDDDDDDDAPYYRILDDIQNYQLLMNYCYGHINSTLLLCPYGSGINYLNHHSTLHNVQLQWIPATSTSFIQTFQHNVTAVEHGTVEDLFRTERSQLALQYVTTRDIQEGEELFIDYGVEWEMAWKLHVQQFFDANENHSSSSSSYISASYFNTMFGHVPLPTVQEQVQHVTSSGPDQTLSQVRHIPNNLQVRCHRALLLQEIGNMDYHYVWSDENHGVPCRIIDRFDPHFNPASTVNSENDAASAKDFLYTIQLEWNDGIDDMTWILRTDVPRSAIKLYDVPYTSDIHQRRTFRHPIYLTNELFPTQWRNLE